MKEIIARKKLIIDDTNSISLLLWNDNSYEIAHLAHGKISYRYIPDVLLTDDVNAARNIISYISSKIHIEKINKLPSIKKYAITCRYNNGIVAETTSNNIQELVEHYRKQSMNDNISSMTIDLSLQFINVCRYDLRDTMVDIEKIH